MPGRTDTLGELSEDLVLAPNNMVLASSSDVVTSDATGNSNFKTYTDLKLRYFVRSVAPAPARLPPPDLHSVLNR